MSSNQIKQLIELIKNSKDKKEQAKLKKILKELLSKTKKYKINTGVKRKPKLEVQTGIKEQVEKLINPVLSEFKDDKTTYEEITNEKEGEIEDLQQLLKEATSPNEVKTIQAQIETVEEDKSFIINAQKANLPIRDMQRFYELKEKVKAHDSDSLRNFQYEVRKLFPNKIDDNIKSMITTTITRYEPSLKKSEFKGSTKKRKEAYKNIFDTVDAEVLQIIKDEEPKQESLEAKDQSGIGQGDDQSNWGQASSAVANQALSSNISDDDAQQEADQLIAFLNANLPNNDPNDMSATIPSGEGKRKRKVKGGAGFEDYLSFFGNIPGGSQALSMIPGFGSVLAPVFDLAQSASKIGSEIGKQVKGSPEKMSGDALSSLSPMKSLLPFKLPFGNGKRKTKGGNISGMFNQVGELTPQLSGVISKAPGAYGTLGALGNSQLGSISRVFGDIFSRFGLGKKPKRNIKGCGAVSMQGQNIPLSNYNQDLTTKGIINNRLAKAKGQMAEVQKFNRSLNQKANVDQQNAVSQLFYTKLMYDVDKIQKEQKAEREKARKVAKKN
jgi:hypothetical protein